MGFCIAGWFIHPHEQPEDRRPHPALGMDPLPTPASLARIVLKGQLLNRHLQDPEDGRESYNSQNRIGQSANFMKGLSKAHGASSSHHALSGQYFSALTHFSPESSNHLIPCLTVETALDARLAVYGTTRDDHLPGLYRYSVGPRGALPPEIRQAREREGKFKAMWHPEFL